MRAPGREKVDRILSVALMVETVATAIAFVLAMIFKNSLCGGAAVVTVSLLLLTMLGGNVYRYVSQGGAAPWKSKVDVNERILQQQEQQVKEYVQNETKRQIENAMAGETVRGSAKKTGEQIKLDN